MKPVSKGQLGLLLSLSSLILILCTSPVSAQFGQPGMPRGPGFVQTVWKCRKCGQVVGTGPFRPINVNHTCPGSKPAQPITPLPNNNPPGEMPNFDFPNPNNGNNFNTNFSSLAGTSTVMMTIYGIGSILVGLALTGGAVVLGVQSQQSRSSGGGKSSSLSRRRR